MIIILPELSINGDNDERKLRRELNNYLLKISNDVKLDIDQVASFEIRQDGVRAKAIKAFNLLFTKDYSNVEAIIDGGCCFIEFYFIPNESGFEAIKTSSYLGKITNTKLDSLLIGYHAIVDLIENRDQGYNTFIEEMEADLKKSVDVLTHQAFNLSRWNAELLDIDTSDLD
jgi:hypothetical protein